MHRNYGLPIMNKEDDMGMPVASQVHLAPFLDLDKDPAVLVLPPPAHLHSVVPPQLPPALEPKIRLRTLALDQILLTHCLEQQNRLLVYSAKLVPRLLQALEPPELPEGLVPRTPVRSEEAILAVACSAITNKRRPDLVPPPLQP